MTAEMRDIGGFKPEGATHVLIPGTLKPGHRRTLLFPELGGHLRGDIHPASLPIRLNVLFERSIRIIPNPVRYLRQLPITFLQQHGRPIDSPPC